MRYYKIVQGNEIIGNHCGEQIPIPEDGWVEITQAEYEEIIKD